MKQWKSTILLGSLTIRRWNINVVTRVDLVEINTTDTLTAG
jgi:hypothetical protein